ncbi:hypothetical protein BKA62DRAFT_681421 [Auriculariales sp. MPI-PUGE-AT-0066]|nr:hypothetical protein BKA62DRAFT_681421 [Auriculariales sp. MPI-PUGE-AT-0066]
MQLTLVKRPTTLHRPRSSVYEHQQAMKRAQLAALSLSPAPGPRRRKPTVTYCTLDIVSLMPSSSSSSCASSLSPSLSPSPSAAEVGSTPSSTAAPVLVLPPIPGRRAAHIVIPRQPPPLYWPFSHQHALAHDALPYNSSNSATTVPHSKNKGSSPSKPTPKGSPDASKDAATVARRTGRATRRSSTQAAKRVQQQLEKEQQKDLAEISPEAPSVDVAPETDAASISKRSPRKKRAAPAPPPAPPAASGPAKRKRNVTANEEPVEEQAVPSKRTRMSRGPAKSASADDADADETQEKQTSQPPEDEPAPRTTRGSRSSTRNAAQKDSVSVTSSHAGSDTAASPPPGSDKAPSKSPSLRKARRSRSAINSPITANAVPADADMHDRITAAR